MAKINFHNIQARQNLEPGEYWCCNGDGCTKHLIIDDQFEIDEFGKCANKINCNACELYINYTLYLRRNKT